MEFEARTVTSVISTIARHRQDRSSSSSRPSQRVCSPPLRDVISMFGCRPSDREGLGHRKGELASKDRGTT